MKAKRSNQYYGSQEEGWASKVSDVRLAKLKEVCQYSENMLPYWCFVLRFNVGPDAKGSCHSWLSITKELAITEDEAHFNKWVAMHILGRRLVDAGHKERKAIDKAESFLETWSKKKKAEAQEAMRQEMFAKWQQEENSLGRTSLPEAPKTFGLKRILEDLEIHEQILKNEITEHLSVIIPLRDELKEWEKELKKYQRSIQKVYQIQERIKALEQI